MATSDLSPKPNAPSNRVVWRWLLVLLLMVGLVGAIFIRANSHSPQVRWLNSAKVFSHHDSLFRKQLHSAMERWLPAVLQKWRSHRQIITSDMNILFVPEQAALHLNSSPPFATNGEGLRAWLFTPAEMQGHSQYFKTNSGVIDLGRPTALTYTGTTSAIRIISPATNQAPGDITVSVFPTGFSDCIVLTAAMRITQITGTAPDGEPITQTNFDKSFRATIPRDDTLVIDTGGNPKSDSNHYWLIIKPSMTAPFDAKRPRR